MSVTTLLDDLHKRDIVVDVEPGNLRIKAPKDAMTDELRQAIREHKAELMALLSPPSAPQSAPEPLSYIKRCSTCGETDWGPISLCEQVWGCLTCDDARPEATTICPVCGSDSIVQDASGRICCRPTCNWRESRQLPNMWVLSDLYPNNYPKQKRRPATRS
jgi:TubC N-terminal docking domain